MEEESNLTMFEMLEQKYKYLEDNNFFALKEVDQPNSDFSRALTFQCLMCLPVESCFRAGTTAFERGADLNRTALHLVGPAHALLQVCASRMREVSKPSTNVP